MGDARMEFIYKLLGLVTQKEVKMLRDDFNAKVDALSVKVDAVLLRLAEAEQNALTQEDLDKIDAVSAKLD